MTIFHLVIAGILFPISLVNSGNIPSETLWPCTEIDSDNFGTLSLDLFNVLNNQSNQILMMMISIQRPNGNQCLAQLELEINNTNSKHLVNSDNNNYKTATILVCDGNGMLSLLLKDLRQNEAIKSSRKQSKIEQELLTQLKSSSKIFKELIGCNGTKNVTKTGNIDDDKRDNQRKQQSNDSSSKVLIRRRRSSRPNISLWVAVGAFAAIFVILLIICYVLCCCVCPPRKHHW